jgi:TonB family protein
MRPFVLPIVCLVLMPACGPKTPADGPSLDAANHANASGGAAGGAGANNTDPETMPLSGTLSNEQIQKAVNDGVKGFDACYTLGADKDGKLEGTVTIQATVGPLGTVNEASVSKTTMKNPKVDACVVDAFKKLKFPQPDGGSTVMISYPMTFGGEVVTKK